MDILIEALTFSFFQRALVIGGLLAVLCALLGNFVVIRKEALVGHTIANVSFLGVALGLLFQSDINIWVLILSTLGVVLMLFLHSTEKFSYDSILALIAEVSMAGAIVTISMLPGYRPEITNFLFGSILAVSNTDMWFAIGLSVIGVGAMLLLKKKLLQVVFNKELAKSVGVHDRLINFLYLILLAFTIAMGVKIIGIVLIAAFLVIPPNIAKVFARNFSQMMWFSLLFALLGTIIGLFVAYFLDVPSGGMIILTLGAMLLLGVIGRKVVGR